MKASGGSKNKRIKMAYNFTDLFASCGGLSEGILQTGQYRALAHIEWEKPMVDTLRNRLVQQWDHTEEDARKKVVLFDIQKNNELVNSNWTKYSSLRMSSQYYLSSYAIRSMEFFLNHKSCNHAICRTFL